MYFYRLLLVVSVIDSVLAGPLTATARNANKLSRRAELNEAELRERFQASHKGEDGKYRQDQEAADACLNMYMYTLVEVNPVSLPICDTFSFHSHF